MTKIGVLLAVLFLIVQNGFAQIVSGNALLNRLNAVYVKSLDEFMQRFNAEEFHPDIIFDEDENLRMRSLLSVVDWQRFNIEDSSTHDLLMSFSEAVCWNDILLYRRSQGLYAEAQCLFEYDNRDIPINIVFIYENIRDDFYKWAVVGANGLVECKIIDTNRNGYFYPVQHEFNFSDLSAACETDLTRYVSIRKPIDQLSFLLGMLKTRQCKFVSCNNVLFHFLQIPGFVFVVDKANRKSINSGYLINSLFRVEEQNKQKYIKQLTGVIEK